MRAEAKAVRAVQAAPGRDGAAPAATARRHGPELMRAFAQDAAPVGPHPAFVPRGAARGGDGSRVLLMRQLQRTQGNRAVEQWLRKGSANDATLGATPARVLAPVGTGSVVASPARAPAPSRVAARAQAASAPTVQRDAAPDAPWWKIAAFGESVAWKMAEQFAPQLTPVLRKGPEGVTDWLKTRASGAADAVVDGLMSPVRSITGVGGQLTAQFTPMLGALQDAATKIAANDCSPIAQAADKIEKTAEKIVGPIVQTLQPVVAKVQGFLGTVWDKIGAPIWDWIKDYAGQQWDQVKQLASWVWSLTEPMRSLGADAWTWLKNRIGIGDGPQGENGVLQWLQGKFEAAWQSVKTALAPFTKQIGVVRAALSEVADTFTGGVARVGSLVAQVGKGLGWIVANIGNGRALIAARSYVEKSLIPPLVDGLHRTSSAVTGLATSIGGALHKVAAGLDGAAGAVAGSALHFAASAVQWIAGEVTALAGWAGDKLQGVATWLESAVGKLQTFLHGVVEFLGKVGGVIGDVWKLPMFLAEKVWHWIPACIRDPVVDFVVPIILRQIELFEELVRDNDAWQKTKVQVMGIVRLVFVNRDLVGAVKACFNLLLRVLNIPPDMLGKVAAKAMAAWDVVSKKPLDFIKNTVRSLGQGFKLLWANIGTHMEHGIEGWLFGELKEKDVHPPKKWSDPKDVFGFAVEVLGVSIGHVTELLKKRIDPKLVDKVQGWIGRFSRAWDWVTHVIDTSKSPAENTRGVIDQAKDFGKAILTGAVEWIAGKVATELAVLAAGAAASGGLSEVLDVARRIYKAMLTAKRWAAQILQMASNTLDNVLDIAGGNVSKVGAEFEKIMDKAMPVVIGFLADQVGLGGIGAAIRNIVDTLRAKVDAAILWLIDKAKAGIEAVLGGIKVGVGAVADWLGLRKRFTARDGPHQLYFVGSGTAARLVVASVETDLAQLLREGGPLDVDVHAAADPAQVQALQRARQESGKVAAARVQLAANADDAKARAALDAALDALAVQLETTGVGALAAGVVSPARTTELMRTTFGERIFARQEVDTLAQNAKIPPASVESLLRDLELKQQLRGQPASDRNDDHLYAFGPGGGKLGFYLNLQNRRAHFGYANLQAKWFRYAVLTGALRQTLAQHLINAPPQGSPLDAANDHWLRHDALFRCVRTGNAITFDNAIMGHRIGASEHWNAKGHLQAKQDNQHWNSGIDNFDGPEDAAASSASGSASERYRIPYTRIRSNSEWT